MVTPPLFLGILQYYSYKPENSIKKQVCPKKQKELTFLIYSLLSAQTRCITYNITLCLAMFQAQNVPIFRQMMESTQHLWATCSKQDSKLAKMTSKLPSTLTKVKEICKIYIQKAYSKNI